MQGSVAQVPLVVALFVLLACDAPAIITSAAAAAVAPSRSSSTRGTRKSLRNDPFALLSSAILDKISALDSESSSSSSSSTPKIRADPAEVRSALKSLSAAQSALKGIDGASHELYQRTHKSASAELQEDGSGPAGRAARSAARLGCVADGLFAGELCELVERPEIAFREEKVNDDEQVEEEEEEIDDTLSLGDGREIWLNVTVGSKDESGANDDLATNILVLYERSYDGGAGFSHGGIDGVLSRDTRPPRGRLIVILKDEYGNDLPATMGILDKEQQMVSLDLDGSAAEAGLPSAARVASVSGPLYNAAVKVLEAILPALKRAEKEFAATATSSSKGSDGGAAAEGEKKTSQRVLPPPPFAIHFVGRSLAGGVAALAATIMDGILPLQQQGQEEENASDEAAPTTITSLSGYGRGRTSAFALGPPPCLSNNIKADFVKSVIHGDDAICRTTRESLDRLCQRTRRVMKGNVLGNKIGWMSNAVSLTVSGVKTHAKGKKGGEKHLSIPGMVFLVRPRRYEGSSIHEVTSSDGAIKVRSAVLWQLNDVLLSKSLWAHHSLNAYIRGLDRVQLRSMKTE